MSSPSFTEKSATEWYYQIRYDASRHGLVNEVSLRRMATEGLLKPDDFVWNRTRGDRWVPARTIPDLFPPEVLSPSPLPPPPPPVPTAVSPRHRTTLPLLFVIGAFAISLASWVCQKIRSGEQSMPQWMVRLLGVASPETTGEALSVQLISLYLDRNQFDKAEALILSLVRHGRDYPAEVAVLKERLRTLRAAASRRERLQYVLQEVQAFLERELPEPAEPLIRELAQTEEYRAKAEELTARLQAIRRQQIRQQTLERALREGRLKEEAAREMVAVYTTGKRLDELLRLTDTLLRAGTNAPPAAVLSVAYVYLAMDKTTLARFALQQFAGLAALATPADCLQGAALSRRLDDPATQAVILESYLSRVSTDADAWIELAALRAQAGHKDAALDCLKAAEKIDKAKVRERASDPRFDSIRETWTFRRLTR